MNAAALSEASRAARFRTTVLENRYIPQEPTPRQTDFLSLDCEEAFYGGSAAGGKSSGLLMCALQYVDIPNSASLILRRTYSDLTMPGALIHRSHEWLDSTDARWNEQQHIWTFPGGAKMAFGYLDSKRAHLRYQSTEFQTICLDELTEFDLVEASSSNPYLFMRSRLRRTKILEAFDIPLRLRSGSNPGGPGHEFVKRRFVNPGIPGVVFVPAKLRDNPHVDQESYEATLMHLPPVLRAQLLEGNWDVSEGGKVISRLWFVHVVSEPLQTTLRCRSWDLAASTDGKRTAGVLMSRAPRGNYPYEYCVEHAVKGHWVPGERDDHILQQAKIDDARFGTGGVQVLIEQEPGSGGVAQNYEITKKLRGHAVMSIPVRGERSAKVSHFSAKVMRAGPFASAAQRGDVGIIGGEWNDEYLDELHNFPEGKYSDQIDATSMAYNWLSEREFMDIAPRTEQTTCECGRRPHEDWCDEGFAEKQADVEHFDRRDAGKIWRGE